MKRFHQFYLESIKIPEIDSTLKFQANQISIQSSDINNLTKVFKINREMIPVALDKDELIFIIEPVIIKEWIDQTKQSYTTQEWEIYKRENEPVIKLYDNLKENDNPVIAKLKLKTF